ncbi:hypothetical protein [Blastopirellula marina]|uniref:Uncharacterized protein n=1 Tax=Blastopirellula marina TaxID=124 RepID=A0A2S8GRL0_9BACT|nr:hypothetical protein [Blastopirellula marina]PQO47011.1 hypothetical protein C5Y93_05820 [Blastopirellula marina]
MSAFSENPEYFDPSTGKPRNFESRRRYRAEKDKARQLAKATAAHATRRAAKPTSGYEADIAAMKSQLKKTYSRVERQQIKRRLIQYEEAHEKWENEQVIKQWEADFDKSDLAKLAGESVERIKRSGSVMYPNASPEQLDELLSLFEVRYDFPTPGDFAREFFVTLGTIEDGEAEAAQKVAEDTRIESERLAAESAKADLAAFQAKQRANQARENVNDE